MSLIVKTTNLSFGVLVYNDEDSHCLVPILNGVVIEGLNEVLVSTVLDQICLAVLREERRREGEGGREREEGGRGREGGREGEREGGRVRGRRERGQEGGVTYSITHL